MDMSTLIGATRWLIGFGVAGALGFFIGLPVHQFFDLRSEANREMVAFTYWRGNVFAPPQPPADRIERLKKTREKFIDIGGRLLAFGNSEKLVTRGLQFFGYEPGTAGAALAATAEELERYGAEYRTFFTAAKKALKL